MKTLTSDKTMRESVERELEWNAALHPAHVTVAANDGAIVLTGHVPTYAEKWETKEATERVYGVRAVVDDLEVKLAGSGERDDADIAEDVARHMQTSTAIPEGVKAEVKNGHVVLRGEVNFLYQLNEAERALRYLRGVRSLTNLITVRPHDVKTADVTHRISEAIERMAHLDARSIWATSSNGTVRLQGHVHSFTEKHTAGLAAASAPGVTKVENDVVVTP